MFGFPNPVNEVSARLVAAGVVLMVAVTLAFQQHWLLAVIAYGFLARLATGPRLSPLGQFVTRVVTPRLPVAPRPVPGPPKRFAQGIGAAVSVSGAVAAFGFGQWKVAEALLALLLVAAGLEAFLGICLGCWLFARLIRLGLVPERICAECADLTLRPRSPTAAST
ncbi:MAG: DUF4395 domain-containing protein [Acidimicrobiales bacterium]